MRIAVLSDVHANLPALDAVLADAGNVDGVWHLGDVVGYGPDPDGVVQRLREVGAIGVRGNHDAAACGGSEIDWFNPEARRAMEWTRAAISQPTIDWLAAHPERRAEGSAELVHGSYREPLWEYVTSESVAGANLDALHEQVGLHGHTHVPVAWLEDGEPGGERGDRGDRGAGQDVPVGAKGDRLTLVRARAGGTLELRGRRALVNPGSVGQPRDGDRDASYLLWEPESERVTWRRVRYDVAAVQRAMRDAGLPASLVTRLSLGL